MSEKTYETQEVLGYFEDADAFEMATERLLDSGITRDAIHLMASHVAMHRKLKHVFGDAKAKPGDELLPEPIYNDRKS